MAFKPTQISCKIVNQEARHIVFGYCRRYEILLHTDGIDRLHLEIIPPLVKYLCIGYYGIPEYFTTNNPFTILTKNNKIATIHPNYISDSKSNQGIFGNIRIKPNRLEPKIYV